MTEKVKLPKDVCEALDRAKKDFFDTDIIHDVATNNITRLEKVLVRQDANKIMRALVLGYEPELTAEQKLEELYWNPVDVEEFEIEAHRKAIRDVFEIQGIHYDWLEDDAE